MADTASFQANLTEFFRGLVRESMQAQEVDSSEDTEFYLVRLLERYARVEREWLAKPIAIEYLESFHASAEFRVTKLRRVADTTLLLTGLFVESVQHKPVGTEYYVRMGKSAYAHLASLSEQRRRAAGESYAELSTRFTDFMRVRSEISFERLFPDDRRLLRTYSRWLETHNARDARWLVRRGLLPSVAPGGERGH